MKESKKGSGIGLGIVLAILIIAVLGGLYFFFTNKQNNEQMSKAMEKPAIDYFNNYMSVNSVESAYKVTLGMLKEANNGGENYNLSTLDKCDDNKTYATITIDLTNGKVKNTEITLNCEKF